MNNKIAGHDYIAHTLKGYGITHIFYVEAMLRMTLRELEKLGVKTVLTHTENAAAYMADGYARMSGKAGVCLAQSIGAANLAGGIHEAWLANSPVIALTGKKAPNYQYRGAYQEADHRLLYEGITKFNAEISQCNQLPTILGQCFRASVTGKPRPVHVDITNHMGRIIEIERVNEPIYVEEIYKEYPSYRPMAEVEMINKAVKQIEESERPVIVIGRGAAISKAGKVICDFAKKTDIPVATTPDGKTLIDESSDLWCGIAGGYGMDCANKTVLAADIVIFIGTQAGDQTTLEWNVPPTKTRIIQIDIDPAELGKNYPNTIGLCGDAKKVMEQLLERVAQTNRNSWRNRVKKYVKDTLNEYSRLQNSDATPMRPERLCEELSKSLPADAILVADTGYSAVWSATMLRMKESQKYIRSAGSLGWSYPASLGVKCASPDRPVICFTGDGAFYYHLSEMETAVRNGINTVTVINNNKGLLQCRPDLKLVHKDNPQYVDAISCFEDTDFCKVADACGCWAKRVDKAEDISDVLKEAIALNRPAIIDVRTDIEAEVPKALIL